MKSIPQFRFVRGKIRFAEVGFNNRKLRSSVGSPFGSLDVKESGSGPDVPEYVLVTRELLNEISQELYPLMEDFLSKIPRRKTEKPLLGIDHYNNLYGVKEDGTTSHTAGILAAAGVKPEPTEQAVTVTLMERPEEIDSPLRPPKRPKTPSKTQNDVALSESGISMRLVEPPP